MSKLSELISSLDKSIAELEAAIEAESKRLNAIANGFSVWQTINLETNEEQWYCQYAIDGVVCGDTLREALDKGIEANDKNQLSSG